MAILNYVRIERRSDGYGFFATKAVNGNVEIWIATETETRLFLSYPDIYALRAAILSAMPVGTSGFYLFLYAIRDVPSPDGPGFLAGDIATVIDVASVSAATEGFASLNPNADLFSHSPIVRGFWPVSIDQVAGGTRVRLQDRFFSQTGIEFDVVAYFAPLPNLVFFESDAQYTTLNGLGVLPFIPNPDYSGSLGFTTGSSTLRPVAWVSSSGVVTELTGGAFRSHDSTLTFSITAEATSRWWLSFPYVYYLTNAPSTSDDSSQPRVLEKWEIDLNAGTISLLGTVTLQLRGFNDPSLTYKCYAIPVSVLNALPLD